MSEEATIIELFQHASASAKRFICELIQESFHEFGRSGSIALLSEWKILSSVLNTACKISCLRDKNHRLLILEFMKAEATAVYKNSYFNHAKIDSDYIKYLKKIGPYEFVEILTIVNKLKLIEKHHRLRMEAMIVFESHIEQTIRKILEICNSEKRKINNNLNKFKAIVEFEDRIELIKELGKLLRQSWSTEKKRIKAGLAEKMTPQQVKSVTLEAPNFETPFELLNIKSYFIENEKTGIESFFDDFHDFI